MKITVAICTWNRCRLLNQTLNHLTKLQIPHDTAWELILVDNNSTDETKQVVDRFSTELPIRYILELKQGHSHSRNTAVANATGDLIVWTDNDVIVPSNWITSYVEGAKKNPAAIFFGGKIVPVFESAKPDWLAETWDKCKSVYADRDLGDQEFELEPGQFPYGANFAVRTDIQKELLFNVHHGRTSQSLTGEDEIGILQRMTHAGFHGIWLPTAGLQHVIPENRATPEYVGQYFVGQGQANVFNHKATMKSPFHAFRVAIHHRGCYIFKRNNQPADVWVSHLIRASIAWGEFLAMGTSRTNLQSPYSGSQ